VGYLDLRKISVEEAARLAVQKVEAAKSRGATGGAEQKPAAAPAPRVGKLTVKKKFSQQERDEYLDEAFETVATFFKDTLEGLPSQSPGFSGKYKRVTANHFTGMIYRDGERVAQCGIYLGGSAFADQIVFTESLDSTNSMNEGVRVADDGEKMFLKSSGMSSMMRGKQKDCLSPHDAAELFWGVLTWRLQQ
jgi:hypothetical protein